MSKVPSSKDSSAQLVTEVDIKMGHEESQLIPNDIKSPDKTIRVAIVPERVIYASAMCQPIG